MPGNFHFGLGRGDERRAARLHRESIVIDLLSQHAGGNIFEAYPAALRRDLDDRLRRMEPDFDAFLEAIYWPYERSKLGQSDLIRDWYLEGGLTCGTYGIEVHDGRDPQPMRWEERVFRYADLPWLRYVTTVPEIRQAKLDGVIAAYGHCQPVTPAPRNIAAFDVAYRKGLRSFMLT
jgi:membrane dipeptidase